jgi:hypothetical protein
VPVWALPLLALLGWFAGLLPWFVARRTVGTFGTPWNPRNDLREALLPFHHEQLVLLLSVVLVSGALAGLASWSLPRRRQRRLLATFLTTLGALVATAVAAAQTLSPHPDLGGSGQAETSLQYGLVGLTATSSIVGLALGLLASLGGPVVRTLALAPLAVVAVNWVGLLATHLASSDPVPAPPASLPSLLPLLTGLLTGLALAALGLQPPQRVLAWVLALALVWVTGSAFTAVRYLLENLRAVRSDVPELGSLVRDAARIFAQALTPGTEPWTALAVAVAVGLAGTAGRSVRSRARLAGGVGGDG